MALNDTYLLVVEGQLAGQVYMHTLHFREGIESVALNPHQDLIDQWVTNCQTQFLAAHSSAYQTVRISAQRICGALPLPSRHDVSNSAPGTRTSFAGDALAPWLALCVNESTGLAGRSRHGRYFMSGGYESDVAGESLGTAAEAWFTKVNLYNAALAAEFVDPVTPLSWHLVVYSKKLASVPGTECQDSSTPVTSLGTVARLTTIKSRRA